MVPRADIRSWGPAGWTFLTTVALQYPTDPDPEQAQTFRSFFQALRTTLPCAECRSHFAAYVGRHPVPSDRDALVRWLHRLRNEIRTRDRKPPESFGAFVGTFAPVPTLDNLLRLSPEERAEAARAQRHANRTWAWVAAGAAVGVALVLGVVLAWVLAKPCRKAP